MSKHTPGPWETFKGQDGWGIVGLCGGYYGELSEANARLIAAAPELLEALHGLLLFPNNPRENNKARAAIAKATGERA